MQSPLVTLLLLAGAGAGDTTNYREKGTDFNINSGIKETST